MNNYGTSHLKSVVTNTSTLIIVFGDVSISLLVLNIVNSLVNVAILKHLKLRQEEPTETIKKNLL